MRSAWQHLAALLLCALIAVAGTWPLTKVLDRAVADPGDPYINAWILDWVWFAVTNPQASVYNPPLFHPAKLALTFSENLFGVVIVTAPLRLLHLTPLEFHNVTLLTAIALSGYGAFVLGRCIGATWFSSMMAALFFSMMPWRFTHLTHLQHQWGVWLALLIGSLFWFRKKPNAARATAVGLTFLLNGLTNLHWLVFSVPAVLVVVMLLFLRRSRESMRSIAMLAAAITTSALILFVILWPYHLAREHYGLRGDRNETLAYSARAADWLIADPGSRWGSLTNNGSVDPERWLFPGLFAIACAGIAAWPARPEAASRVRKLSLTALDALILTAFLFAVLGAGSVRHLYYAIGSVPLIDQSSATNAVLVLVALLCVRFIFFRQPVRHLLNPSCRTAIIVAAALCGLGFVGSLGMNSVVYRAAFDFLEPVSGIRVPARWAMLGYLGASMLIAIAVTRLTATRTVGNIAIAFSIAAAAVYDLYPSPRYFMTDAFVPPVYEWLGRQSPSTVVLELPLEHVFEYDYVLHSTVHKRPLINGASGFAPKHHVRLTRFFAADPIASEALDLAEVMGADLIVVHSGLLGGRGVAIRSWLTTELGRGRIEFIKRFDGYGDGDYVFRVARQRSPLVFSDVTVERFLRGEHVRQMSRSFGALDLPRHGDRITRLHVSGWAIAPHGIREVRVHLQNGQVTIPARAVPYALIDQLFAEYSPSSRRKFELILERRPRGVSAETDVQVEIEDLRGGTTFLPDTWIHWDPSP